MIHTPCSTPQKNRSPRTHGRGALGLPLALLALLPAIGHSDELDTFQFRAGQSFQHDSNVFRLSDSANTQAVLGRSERSDTIGVTTLGFKINKPYSLQRFEFDVSAEDYNYKNFSSLDFTAINYAAAWRWSLTPALRGNLTTDRRQYVDNLGDMQNFGQINRRTDRSTVADAEFQLGGPWRLLGGAFNRTTRNSVASTLESDYNLTGAQAGVRYVYPSGTSLAYQFKSGDGEYPTRVLSPFFAKDFTEREHELSANWTPIAKTTLRARLSHLQRKHDGLAARDFSGPTAQVDVTLDATPKTALTAGYIRELENYQSNTSSYFAGNRFFVAPVYKATEKIAVRARYDYGWRDYRGALPGFVPDNREDKLSLLGLSVEYQALRSVTLKGWIQRDRRSSNTPGFDYTSNAVGISALASF